MSKIKLLTLTDVTKTYLTGDEPYYALKHVDTIIYEGEYIAIKGPSGSGKSTLMHIMGLLDTPTSGKIELLGKDVSTLSEKELAKLRNRYIGFVFQQFHLLPKTPSWQNVSLPLIYSGVNGRERKKRAILALEKVGLSEKINNTPSQLSGGQQQRVAIARALINNPKMILADEPTGNLDTKSGEAVMKMFDDLHKQGITIILVTHEEDIAQHARRRITIIDGNVSV
jgi:putative ABC transport system ATP-binding protein